MSCHCCKAERHLKIIVNAMGYVGQSGGAGGAGVFLQYLIEHLAEQHPVDVVTAAGSKNFAAARHRARFIELPYVTGETLNHLRAGPTAVIDPFGALPCAPYPENLALCTIIHDLMHLEQPHFFTASERDGRSRSFADGVERSDACIVFSEDQARAVRRFYPGSAPIVIPHLPYAALKGLQAPSPTEDTSGFEPFLLFPAVRWPHKNHRTVLNAFAAYVRHGASDLRLILCGGACAESRYSYYPDQADISDRVVDLGHVTETMLGSLLDRAQAVLFPTLYEGFGIPVLEAAYSGKMVIASRLAVFDEILGRSGYYAVEDPLCQMRWMQAFASAEGRQRTDFEVVSRQQREKVQPAKFLAKFISVLQAAADRYTDPSLYPQRTFRHADRLTSSVMAQVAFADIHGTAHIERGARHPALGPKPDTQPSLLFRSTEAAAERRVCLRATYDVGEAPTADPTQLVFSCWMRLRAESGLEALRWSINDGDVVDLLPELRNGDWYLFRRPVAHRGYIDFRASQHGIAEAPGFDLELHNACLLHVGRMPIPVPDTKPRQLMVLVDALPRSGLEAPVKESALPDLLSAIAELETALNLGGQTLTWTLLVHTDSLGPTLPELRPNVRMTLIDGAFFDREQAARLITPYEKLDQLVLLAASDVPECLAEQTLRAVREAVNAPRMAGSVRLDLSFAEGSIWGYDERGQILDLSGRTGLPIPCLDREVITRCLAMEPTKLRPRFAVIETDLVGGISHHSVVTGLFLAGAEACGFRPLLGVSERYVSDGGETLETWVGFRAQVYQPGAADDFACDLATFIADKKLGPNDVIFMHSLSPQIVLGAARYVAAHPAAAPRFAMRFFSTAEAMAGHKLSYTKILKSIASTPCVSRRLQFFCESRNLRKYYRREAGADFPILLNPEHPSLAMVRNSDWFDPGLGGGRHPTLAYFGEARAEKGFDYIPGILKSLLDNPAMESFHFLIQTGSNSLNQTPEMTRAKDALRLLKGQYRDRVRTFESAETPEEFYFLMKHAVGVISPYRPSSYGRRGTGVTLEALQMGLVVFAWTETDLFATFQGTGHMIGVPEGGDFAATIAAHFAKGARPVSPSLEALRRSPADICKRLLSFSEPRHSHASALPPILWVGNDTFGEGCSAVYAAQKSALAAMGRDCFELFVPWPDESRKGVPPAAYDAVVYGFESEYEGHGLAWVAYPDFNPALREVLATTHSHGPTYARLRDINSHMVVPESMKLALAGNGVRQTLLNYVHLFPVVDGLVPLEGIVCETHDIVSYQHAVRRGNAVSFTEKIDEFSDMARFSNIVAISQSEQREMANACPASKVFWRLPPFTPEPVGKSSAPADASEKNIDTVDAHDAIFQPTPIMLSRYQSRDDLRGKFELGSKVGRFEFFSWWVFFGHREVDDEDPSFGFSTRQYKWLVGADCTETTPHDVPGLLQLMLHQRQDLRAAFTDEGDTDLAGLCRWEAENGEREHSVSIRSLRQAAMRNFGTDAPTDDNLDGSALEAVTLAQPQAQQGGPDMRDLLERIGRLEKIDMMVVGSNHPANVASFEWFIINIFGAHLAPLGYNLFIAGSACGALRHHKHPGLVLLGRCKTLEPLLRSSLACPIPVIAGSGSPIKTIPALALNGAVTVTEHIERAFGLSAYTIPAFSDPSGFADDVKSLLVDECFRSQRIAASRRYVEERLGLAAYNEFWRNRFS
jgi:glycosyltransferase involved in cell wall biosynthesis